MKKTSFVLVAVFCAALALPALAQKDNPGHGHGKGNQGQGQGKAQNQGQGNASGTAQVNVVVTERDRGAIYGYYRPLYAAGNCPPGLAKKNNGCLPPGQAKKLWVVGQPLAAGVVYYPLPGPLLAQLTPAPAGYQYVRVANDILMMAVGTRLIAGAVADLGSM
jgi:hypothetical protein